jgi:pimeloyl-ACP methyl ester carboxylesterase
MLQTVEPNPPTIRPTVSPPKRIIARANGPRVWASAEVPDLADLSRRSPQRAGDIAFRNFCEPHRSERREAGHTFLVRRARRFLKDARQLTVPSPHGDIPVYVFEPETATPRATVLVAHGWTAEASFMTLFGERLRHMGARAVLLDAPAHGKCKRTRASLVDYTESVLRVAEAYKPDYALAHSMGCFAVLHAGGGGPPFRQRYDFKRYVLIGPPNEFGEITREFADARHMTATARVSFERHLERIAHRRLESFTASNLLRSANRPALLIHSKDDREIPIRHAEAIAEACPTAELLPFDGMGHRKLLSAPQVVRAAVTFLLKD